MRIGIVSDSHGQVATLRHALAILADRDCEAIVHCGDICNRPSVKALGSASGETYLVAGNMDLHYSALARHARRAGVHFSPRSIEVPLGDGQYLVATHGHHHGLLDELVAGQQFPYVCCGHTHRRRDEQCGTVRIICPGALWQPRAPTHPTVAVLVAETNELTFIDLHGES